MTERAELREAMLGAISELKIVPCPECGSMAEAHYCTGKPLPDRTRTQWDKPWKPKFGMKKTPSEKKEPLTESQIRSEVLKEVGAWLEGNCTKGHNDYGGFVNQPKKRRDCEGCRQSLLRGEKP